MNSIKSPGGTTPLCRCVNAVIESIRAHEDEWRQNRQKAVLVIATDGKNDEGKAALEEALGPLKVWLKCFIDLIYN
jgi:Mg-chelatase subunit ChlD